MILIQYGEIVKDQWYWIAKQNSYVTLHEFVVMPNHMHGIIEINRANMDFHVGTGRDPSLHENRNPSQQYPYPKIKSLSELIGAYKTTTSKQIHLAGYPAFVWQRSFHDNIIRDERSFKNISRYIQNNPSSWNDDKFNDH